eukprot:12605189-Alexandrium_andersonii.AAC.1
MGRLLGALAAARSAQFANTVADPWRDWAATRASAAGLGEKGCARASASRGAPAWMGCPTGQRRARSRHRRPELPHELIAERARC